MPNQSLLVFQLGPVQEFIAQARSTRDLWSGSYLLSWLTAHAMRAVTAPPYAGRVVTPSLERQPMFEYIGNPQSLGKNDARRVLMPSLPNRFTAIVPSSLDPEQTAAKAVRDEWSRIARSCWDYLDVAGAPLPAELGSLWTFQVDRAFQTTWVMVPYDEANSASAYEQAHQALAARRQTRNFGAWLSAEKVISAARSAGLLRLEKDAFSGREEAIATREWIKEVCKREEKDAFSGREEAIATREWIKEACKRERLAHLVRKGDPLGAVSVVKRVCHQAYLVPQGFDRSLFDIESVPAIAAAPWRKKLSESDRQRWDAVVDADGEEAKSGREALIRQVRRDIGVPSRYYAVLALDGDEMGSRLKPDGFPDAHGRIGADLQCFALKQVPEIVARHSGRVVYAGGDDVLALLPAETAMTCALELRMAYPSLNVPGLSAATASVGLAMAHVKEPLQDVIAAARTTEHRAKIDYGRNALAVTLFKRSGETVEWGATFGSPAFNLLAFFRDRFRDATRGGTHREPPIGARFPYRVAELLGRFASASLNESLLDVALAEWRWIVKQQAKPIHDSPGERDEFEKLSKAYLDDLLACRGTSSKSQQPLTDFISLFALEAFLNRQGEE